jgi:hypothetical protein
MPVEGRGPNLRCRPETLLVGAVRYKRLGTLHLDDVLTESKSDTAAPHESRGCADTAPSQRAPGQGSGASPGVAEEYWATREHLGV